MHTAVAHAQSLAAPILAPLHSSCDIQAAPSQLQARLSEDGYVYLPGFFPRDEVWAARSEIFGRLHDVGEIAAPPEKGIFTGTSARDERVASRGEFWRSVSESWALRRLTHGRSLQQLMDNLLAEQSCAQDYLFLRPAGPGKSTHIHCDYPFFARETEQVLTAWIALGDIPLQLGPLFIMENSHKFQDLVDSYRGFDVARDSERKAALSETPVEFATARETRVLSTNFGAGDIVVFNMFLMHGALDNVSTNNEVRQSCDVRYQIATAARDPRYFGANPTGTTGAGYGELVGAKAMTEAWHVR